MKLVRRLLGLLAENTALRTHRLISEKMNALAANERLVAALAKYGEHHLMCDVELDKACTCGLTAALAAHRAGGV